MLDLFPYWMFGNSVNLLVETRNLSCVVMVSPWYTNWHPHHINLDNYGGFHKVRKAMTGRGCLINHEILMDFFMIFVTRFFEEAGRGK